MRIYILFLLILPFSILFGQEQSRPNYHFTPKSGWMNDPNGMIYKDGKFHLFFQHNPNDIVWGPMHWGHAISKDMIVWEEQKIALYPDSLGTIYSGSAVVDKNNTSGFGKNSLVAIYTNHSHEIEKTGSGLHETQSIAYSLDDGKSWIKYSDNPVISNPGIKDFRDPKVLWHEPTASWVMVLATLDCITFYNSKDLKEWQKAGEFGKNLGSHEGVWECPDLLKFKTDEGEKWVLIVSVNPGAPNTGSGTQYFIGDFDGHMFKSNQKGTKWLDYGPDNYAGVTFSNLNDRNVLMGWMSNWSYANQVPATTWRSGNTIARELKLVKIENQWELTSLPVKELNKYRRKIKIDRQNHDNIIDFDHISELKNSFELSFSQENVEDFKIIFKNKVGEKIIVGYDSKKKQYFIDRSNSGNVEFNKNFIKTAYAARISNSKQMSMRILIDKNSVELFADHGLTCLSSIYFNEDVFDSVQIIHNNLQNNIDVKFYKIM